MNIRDEYVVASHFHTLLVGYMDQLYRTISFDLPPFPCASPEFDYTSSATRGNAYYVSSAPQTMVVASCVNKIDLHGSIGRRMAPPQRAGVNTRSPSCYSGTHSNGLRTVQCSWNVWDYCAAIGGLGVALLIPVRVREGNRLSKSERVFSVRRPSRWNTGRAPRDYFILDRKLVYITKQCI